jgi:hypothetical protein
MAQERRRETRSFQERAYLDKLTLNALVDLLSEKGLVNKQELMDRVKETQAKMQARKKSN